MSHVHLTADQIEWIHDEVVVAFLPQYGHVSSKEPRDRNLLESAVGRPFHTYQGEELSPSLESKAALLFHAICCNYCFFDGNKRTAVLSLDLFLLFNDHVLLMNIEEAYELAKWTAEANSVGRSLTSVIGRLEEQIAESVVSVGDLSGFSNYPVAFLQLRTKIDDYRKEAAAFFEPLRKVIEGRE